MMSSDTSAPESITFFAASPSGVPAFTAARSMSPVEICGMPYASLMKVACVPLPAPGGPRRISRMVVDSQSVDERGDRSTSVRAGRRGSRLCAVDRACRQPRVGDERAHALQVLRRIDAGRRRAARDLDDDAVAVPQRAQLLERLEALDRRGRQRGKRRRNADAVGVEAVVAIQRQAAAAACAVPRANASRAQGIVARLK